MPDQQDDSISRLFNNIASSSFGSAGLQDLVDRIPASIYWKDRQGQYITANRYFKEVMVDAGFKKELSKIKVQSKSDMDLFGKDNGLIFQENDAKVMLRPDDVPLKVVEDVIIHTGVSITMLSIKRPLFDNGNIAGILGCSIDIGFLSIKERQDWLGKPTLQEATSTLKSALVHFMTNETGVALHQLIDSLQSYALTQRLNQESMQQLLSLSKRELQCICLLAKCWTAKQIGIFLGVSPRTVEVFLQNIRQKLKLIYKADLANWFWKIFSGI